MAGEAGLPLTNCGARNVRKFGSFQIDQYATPEPKRRAAAVAKFW